MSKITPDIVIATASNELGYLEKNSNCNLDEKYGNNVGDKNYTKYGRDQGCNGQPWCCAFINWIFIKSYGKDNARLLLGGFSNYTPTAASFFKVNDNWYSQNPQVGDIIFFKNNVRICHVGLVTRVDSNKVYTIEGNTSTKEEVVSNGGGVFAKSYPLSLSRIAGYGRPRYGSIDTSILSNTPILKMGSKNDYVLHVQKFLAAKGYQVGSIDGNYGLQTMNCVKSYQQDNNLTCDGIWGKECWRSVGLT